MIILLSPLRCKPIAARIRLVHSVPTPSINSQSENNIFATDCTGSPARLRRNPIEFNHGGTESRRRSCVQTALPCLRASSAAGGEYLRTPRKFSQKRAYNRGLRGWTRINALLIRVTPRHPRSKSYWVAALPRWEIRGQSLFGCGLDDCGYMTHWAAGRCDRRQKGGE